jgi:hypothetical protein
MDALACFDFFDFNDAALVPARRLDGVHAEPAVTNEP